MEASNEGIANWIKLIKLAGHDNADFLIIYLDV